MSFVTTQPEMLAAAAAHLQSIGSVMSVQNAASAGPTTGLSPAAADEVSALTAAAFAAHGVLYQEISAQAATIHQLFVCGHRGRQCGHHTLTLGIYQWISQHCHPRSTAAECIPALARVRCWNPRRPGEIWPGNCPRQRRLTPRWSPA
jgi:hypothetical protein